MAAKTDRVARIADPRQRVLARRIPEIQDLFCEHFAALPVPERLTAKPGKTARGEERLRNALRMLTLGCVVRLGLDLGCTTHALHGHRSGYTEIAELAGLHYGTTCEAAALFGALIEDRGDLGKWAAGKYKALRRAALADLAATEKPTKAVKGKSPQPHRPKRKASGGGADEAKEAA